ncbi:MAG TPA: cyclophilin-like fold protein [Pyrinomonadaceae bacterium]|jgi:hypothetical protein
MPDVIVKLWPGKSEEQKTRLAEGIVKDTALFLKGASIKRMIEGKRQVLLALALVTFLSCAACGAGEPVVSGTAPERPSGMSNKRREGMKIRLDVEGTQLTATLDDNATTRDFVSLLPLTLTLKDYGETEKISYLSRKLSAEGAPSGSDPSVGDITYYAPWGNLALFYKDFGYSDGLIRLGKIDSGVEALNRPGPLRVTMELVEK